ncbi:MAG: hypothetical protein HY366_02425 [Candidatus Aenigmarchaeota archaeon]|nr:hypothetical protein [Candidatus Aenigmarchaeota archaeon]
MVNKKTVAEGILAAAGLFFLILPHSVHTGFGLTAPHTVHMGIGAVLLAAAGALHFYKKK